MTLLCKQLNKIKIIPDDIFSKTLAFIRNNWPICISKIAIVRFMQTRIFIFLCFIIALVNGTGLYRLSAQLQNALYITFLLIILWHQYQKYSHNGIKSIKIDNTELIFFILYNTFITFNILKESLIDSDYIFNVDNGVMRNYMDLIRALYAFILVKVVYNLVKDAKIFVFLPILGLAVLIIGLFLEIQHIINFNENIHTEQINVDPDNNLLERPGGFTNPNMTAALALIFLYMTLESHLKTPIILQFLALILTLIVCSLSQSRAAILFLLIYVTHTIFVNRNINFLITLVLGGGGIIAAAFYFDVDIVTELMDKLETRSNSNEENAHERLDLIAYALNAFYDSPLLGNGIRFVAKTVGHGNSSHNQIIEVLTNWGLVGFAMVFILYMTFYHKNSFPYLTLCIFPTLFFSHNFFDSSTFQASLAFAYCVIDNNKQQKYKL